MKHFMYQNEVGKIKCRSKMYETFRDDETALLQNGDMLNVSDKVSFNDIVAITLGGSRASEISDEKSDYDI